MDPIALMASALHAAQSRLDVSASNLANVSSDGFHKHVAHATLGKDGLAVSTSVDPAEGALRHTGRSFDLALAGKGALYLAGPGGTPIATRGGSFWRDAAGHLADDHGRKLLGKHGLVRVDADATIDTRGVVHDGSGERGRLRSAPGTEIQAGFLETANVDAVREMIDVLGAERAFETAQKTLGPLDEERQKDADDVARVKS